MQSLFFLLAARLAARRPCASRRNLLRLSPRFLIVLGLSLAALPARATIARPNVLFIVSDDLNHWIGSLGRNPQTRTPNLDRLARMGVNFTHAYSAASVCNPSRAALLSGRRPASTGLYTNQSMPWSAYIDERNCINGHFRANGYYTAGAGKIYHNRGGGAPDESTQWDKYVARFGPDEEEARPTTGSLTLSVPPRKGASRVGEFEIGPLPILDDETEDNRIAKWGAQQLAKSYEGPFFLALGFHKPHLPWTVPKKYFELFPLETIELPPHIADDRSDLPPTALRWARNDRWVLVMAQDGERAWKQVVQAYLASVAYLDAQIGIVLEAFEKSAHRDNTILVFFGDHGWHLGEKDRLGKATLWEEAARAPLIWVAPGVSTPGTRCDRTVDFLSIYPTLCDLTGLPRPEFLEGVSIRSLLANPEAHWDRPALTTMGFDNHAVRSEKHRYIRYANGDEELYDVSTDPYEWTNLAGRAEFAAVKGNLARHLPRQNKRDRMEAGVGAAQAPEPVLRRTK